MRLINLESHLFSNSLLSIQAKDLNDFIPSFCHFKSIRKNLTRLCQMES